MSKRTTLLFSLFFPLCLCAVTLSLLPAGLAQAPDVTVWSISVEQDELYRELEATFSERYPEYTVKFETFSQDAFQQNLPLSFESGDAPDVVLASFDIPMSELLANNWLAPVAGNAEIPKEWFARFPETTFVDGHNMVDGVVYGVPTNEQDIWGPGYMFYNRTVLEDAGVDPDAEIPSTWSELLAVCERVKAADYLIHALPLRLTATRMCGAGGHRLRRWPRPGHLSTIRPARSTTPTKAACAPGSCLKPSMTVSTLSQA